MTSLAYKISSRRKNSYSQNILVVPIVVHSVESGMYDDYNYRPDKYNSTVGEICENNSEYDGVVFGKFMCPIEGINAELKRESRLNFHKILLTIKKVSI